MKTLISWIARQNDFIEGRVNIEGPTYTFHKHHYNYDRHILIATKDSETMHEFLCNQLRNNYSDRVIEGKIVAIKDISDLYEVKAVAERILVELAHDEIDIFFSPGSSIMQLSWYICNNSLKLNTRLVQLKRFQHSTNSDFPDLIEIQAEQSGIPHTAMLKQINLSRGSKKDAFKTETLEPVYRKAEKVAQTDNVTTIIYGESGTGKELLAKFIHKNSPRSGKAFKTINCSAFSDQLLESRLFGYKKGSFTGAISSEKGIFEEANNGTLFMDEIGDISPYMQQLLLRVLQEKEIQPINKPAKKVDVRIIAATNQNLVELCEAGNFRWDLYYRLSVVELELPVLANYSSKERKKFIHFFLGQKKIELRKLDLLKLNNEVEKLLAEYHYPGNIRELENIIESLYVFCDKVVEIQDLPRRISNPIKGSILDLKTVEKLHIIKVLNQFKGNKRQTALALGITQATLGNKLKLYGLQ